MTDQWNPRPGVHDAPTPDAGEQHTGRTGGPDGDRRLRVVRSAGDRKIAGVAGGLGRAFGVDPILLRVAFVVLTIFGGVGGLLYVLGWLLLPADGDEVSAAEALLGRGRSSVPGTLAVGLGVVAVISVFSMFSWGLPFLPLAVGGAIVLAVLHRRHRQWHAGQQGGRGYGAGSHDPSEYRGDRTQSWAGRGYDWSRRAQHWGEQASRWADEMERRAGSGRWGCQGGDHRGVDRRGSQAGRPAGRPTTAGSSPFQRPAFWEQPSPADRLAEPRPQDTAAPGAQRVDQQRVDLRKTDLRKVDLPKNTGPAVTPDPEQGFGSWPGPDGRPRTTPPAWDPLGVAPFAWDLPEPAPLPAPAPPRPRSGAGVLPQVTLGATLLVGGVLAGGVFAGWWALTWAQVAGVSLAVLAVGLLLSALRGGGRSLIGSGVFLSLVTLALAVTGLSGTSGYGDTSITPGSVGELQSSYTASAGELDLDFSGVRIPRGTVKTVEVELKAGHVQVAVSGNTHVVAVCTADVGRTRCLGEESKGLRTRTTRTVGDAADSGTLRLDVTVRAGLAEVVGRG